MVRKGEELQFKLDAIRPVHIRDFLDGRPCLLTVRTQQIHESHQVNGRSATSFLVVEAQGMLRYRDLGCGGCYAENGQENDRETSLHCCELIRTGRAESREDHGI